MVKRELWKKRTNLPPLEDSTNTRSPYERIRKETHSSFWKIITGHGEIRWIPEGDIQKKQTTEMWGKELFVVNTTYKKWCSTKHLYIANKSDEMDLKHLE